MVAPNATAQLTQDKHFHRPHCVWKNHDPMMLERIIKRWQRTLDFTDSEDASSDDGGEPEPMAAISGRIVTSPMESLAP